MRFLTAFVAASAFCLGMAQSNPETGSHLPSQAAADVLRSFASVDGAFLAAGLVKETYQKENLASLLQYPADGVVVISLTGSQVKQAFERSVSLYPQPNASFLQISGFEVTFNGSSSPDQRVVSVTAGGAPLDNARTYQIAMPSSLGRGGLGYFKIWDKTKITKTLPGATMESVLKGKAYAETAPRWTVQG